MKQLNYIHKLHKLKIQKFKLKKIRTDNGIEFVNEDLKNVLKKKVLDIKQVFHIHQNKTKFARDKTEQF